MEASQIEIITDVTQEPWYVLLVDDCNAIVTEAVFISRWALVEGYHLLGERIVTENNLDRKEIYGKKILQRVGESIGISLTTLYYAIQFYEKYPNLDEVPEGKNISWHKLVNHYLPSPLKTETPLLPDGKYRIIYADPPWYYTNSQHTDSANKVGEAQKTTLETHYQSMK
ncbi:MAG: hypothetical protein MUO26_14630, partial [Methanotrichaceae archaeon]|nr:hypothetical protein [Methanotrichaceae archaeon]